MRARAILAVVLSLVVVVTPGCVQLARSPGPAPLARERGAALHDEAAPRCPDCGPAGLVGVAWPTSALAPDPGLAPVHRGSEWRAAVFVAVALILVVVVIVDVILLTYAWHDRDYYFPCCRHVIRWTY